MKERANRTRTASALSFRYHRYPYLHWSKLGFRVGLFPPTP